MNKYLNKKVTTADGIEHDSQKEAQRWCGLKLLEKYGTITDLRRQVKYELIPAQYETHERWGKNGKRLKDSTKVLEKRCCYVADFVYIDAKTGQTVVEDTKGYKRGGAYAIFSIKRKLMLHVHHIRIKEV